MIEARRDDHTPDRDVVGRNFLALGSGEAIARVLAFLATIYVARTLGAASYGTIAFAAAVVLYFSRVADGGLNFGLGVREVAAAPERAADLLPTVLTVRLAVALLLVAALCALGLYAMPRPDGVVLALYSLTLLAVGIDSRWIHLGLEDARRPAVAKTVGEALMVFLVFTTVRGSGDLTRVPLAQFAGDFLAAVLLLGWLRRRGLKYRPTIRWDLVRSLAARAWPLVASGLLGLMIYNSDLIFLRLFRSSTEVGYYAAAYALIAFSRNLGGAYSLSLLPTLTRLGDRQDREQSLYDTANAHVFAATFPLAVGATLLAGPVIGLVFGRVFEPSTPVLALLVWTVPVGVVGDVSAASLMARGRESWVLRAMAIAAVANLLLNLVLIPTWGMLGAALASVTTETIRMVVAVVLARALGFRPTSVLRYWRTVVAGLAMGGAIIATGPASLLIAVPVGVAAFALALTVLGGLRWRGGGLPTLEV